MSAKNQEIKVIIAADASGFNPGAAAVNAQLQAMADKARNASGETTRMFSGVESAAVRAGQKIQESNHRAAASSAKLSDSVSKVAAAGVALIGVNFAAGWVRQAGQVMDAFSGLNSRLTLATGSAKEASAAYAQLFDIAQRSRTSFIDLGSVYSQVARSTAELGISSKEMLRITETIAKTMTISGAPAESMRAALVQLSQGLASGTLRGEELNSVMEQTPRLAQAIAAGMGVSIGQLRQLGSEGKLTAESIMQALASQAGVIDSEFARIKPTIGQAFQTLSDTAGDAIHKLDEAGHVTERVVSAIDGLSSSIRSATASADGAKSLIRLLELLLAVATARGALALLGRLGAPAAAAGGPVAWGATALAWAATSDMSDYARSMKTPDNSLAGLLARQEGYEKPSGGLTPDQITRQMIGQSAYELPKDLATSGQAYDMKRGEVIAAFLKAIKDQKLNQADPAYASLASALSDKLAEMDAEWAKKNKSTGAEARPDFTHLDTMAALHKQANKESADRAKVYEQEARATDVMAQSVNGLAQAYEQRNQKAGEALLSQEERELAQALREVAERAQAARDSLAQKAAAMEDNAAVQAEYRTQLDEVNAKEAAQIALEKANHSSRLAMQQDWRAGADRALKNYQSQALNVAESTEQAFTRAFGGMEDALVSFVQTGKLDFTSLANSIIADIIRIQVRSTMAPLYGSTGQALGLQQAGSALSGGNLLMSAGGALGSSSLSLMGAGASIGWSAAGEAAKAYSAAGMTGEALALQAGAAMPYIAAAMAAYSLFSKDGGGPKTEMYGGSRDVAWGLAQTAPVTAAVDAIAAGVSKQFDSILSGFGKSAALSLGLGGDADPQGTAGSRVGYSLTADGQSRFSEISVASLDDAALAANASRALLAALEAVDINGVVNQYLDGLNIAGLTAEQAAAAVATVQAFDSVADALEAMGAGASALSADMVAAAGGITALQAQLAGYYDKFYSDEEKAADARAALLEQFKALGLAMPETRDGFRALVDSLDLSTASGQKTYAQLIALSGAFATVADAAAAASSAALTAAQSATDAAMTALRNAVATQRTSAQAALDAANEQRAAVKSVFDTLKSSIADLTGAATGTTASAGAAFIDQALATARASGYLPDADALSVAVTAVRSSLTADKFASGADLARAQLQLAGKLTALQSLAAPKLTAAESAAALAQSQLTALDAQLASAQAQVDAARGVGSAKTVQEALADLQAALVAELRVQTSSIVNAIVAGLRSGTISAPTAAQQLAAQAGLNVDTSNTTSTGDTVFPSSAGAVIVNDTIYAANGYVGTVSDAKNIVTDAFNNSSAGDFRAAAISAGLSAAAIDAMYGFAPGTANAWAAQNGLPKFASGGLHYGGVRLVGEQGPELEITGPARYFSADQTRRMLSGGAGQDNAALLAEIKALREEVVNLRAETRSTAYSSAKTARILDAVSSGAETLNTKAAV